MQTIGQLMTAYPEVVGSHTSLAICAHIMEHNDLRHLPVVHENGSLLAVAHDFDVHAGLSIGDPKAIVTSVMDREMVTARANEHATTVLDRQIRARQDCVVIVDDDDHPVGIFTEHDALALAEVVLRPWISVGDVANRGALFVVDANDGTRSALDFMRAKRVRHVIVVDNGAVRGVVSWGDLRSHSGEPFSVISDVLGTRTVHTARANTSLQQAVRVMVREKIGCLPVVEPPGGSPVGILTRSDILDALVRQLVAATPVG